MNWFKHFFSPKTRSKVDQDFFQANDAYLLGEKLWKESILSDESVEFRDNKKIEALKLFDKAIELGFEEEAEIYSMRGSILNDLGFYFDALDDYNKAILNRPKKGIADNYFLRGFIKESIYDYEGAIADVEEAIRLSKLDNDDNKYWDQHYQKIHFQSAADYYDWVLSTIKRSRYLKEQLNELSPKDIQLKLQMIKRRERNTAEL
jgi:tetratricopeptide (TPR) repeat protein